MKVKIHYFWYYSEDNGTTWKRATEQIDANSVEWKDHLKVKWVRKVNPITQKPYKQRLRCEHWNTSPTIPIKEYHIEILDYTTATATTETTKK